VGTGAAPAGGAPCPSALGSPAFLLASSAWLLCFLMEVVVVSWNELWCWAGCLFIGVREFWAEETQAVAFGPGLDKKDIGRATSMKIYVQHQ
jgi:hypothetical protein